MFELTKIAESSEFLWNSSVMTPEGRLFSSMPGWVGPTPGVVEVIADGTFSPFPGNDWNCWAQGKDPRRHLVDVNSILPDGRGSLWVLDAAAPNFGAAIGGAVKLVQLSIATGETQRVIFFDPEDAHPGTRLGHIRFHGDHAIMTESKEGSFFVIDLRDNSYRRILAGHPLMRCAPEDVPVIEGRKLCLPDGTPIYVHNDLLEFGKDPDVIYFMCLFGRKIFKTHIDTFKDVSLSDDQIVARISVAFELDGPWNAGICRDENGIWYLTDAENNGIRRLDPEKNGESELLVSRADLIWPVTPTIDSRGDVRFTVTQANRMPAFCGGKDLIERPWAMYKLATREHDRAAA